MKFISEINGATMTLCCLGRLCVLEPSRDQSLGLQGPWDCFKRLLAKSKLHSWFTCLKVLWILQLFRLSLQQQIH